MDSSAWVGVTSGLPPEANPLLSLRLFGFGPAEDIVVPSAENRYRASSWPSFARYVAGADKLLTTSSALRQPMAERNRLPGSKYFDRSQSLQHLSCLYRLSGKIGLSWSNSFMTKYTATANRSGCLVIAKCWSGIFVKSQTFISTFNS